jgi:hypothetical protein
MLLQVDSTDAEGRLTLADALVYACNQGVDKVMNYSCADGMTSFDNYHFNVLCIYIYIHLVVVILIHIPLSSIMY